MMNTYFLLAGILCFLLGLAHSLIGEYLIFKEKRKTGKLVPTKGSVGLKERHLRIIWATWHLASFFGWCIGAFLVKISLERNSLDSEILDFLINATTYTMFASSFLVLIGTKGKHPGWIVFMLIGILLIAGN
ncbi:hypothetical protein JKA74_14395 [Marivirga sp. S37H4]|uniref:Uncharacterized protein n=1 Tax=Marivirga aurantiaca TaxID=2802615 RepID=A0A935CAJ1_9BACT|nr:hypothetical protein [Marivirga aurantiaca]MBK6266232.1 hypothetical protein [Marivirga aurantiaca]